MKLMRKNSKAALTLVEVLTIVAILMILVAFVFGYVIAPLHYYSARAPGISCMNNLKQTGLAFRLWAQDNNDKFPMEVSITNGGAMESATNGNLVSVFQVMSNELNTPKILRCPADTLGEYATEFENFGRTNISYFANLDGSAGLPGTLLCGDRNITGGRLAPPGILELTPGMLLDWDKKLHTKGWEIRLTRVKLYERGFGNIAYADGSVSALDRFELNQAVQNSGVATNRLIMP
jgi:prepilin-type processing-associated H-X9-DG protein